MAENDNARVAGSVHASPTKMEFGGLRFDVSFRPAGATLRVEGPIDGLWIEMLRFDDFVDAPHFHAPAHGAVIPFDRARLGEPLAWFVAQIRDHLAEWLETAGYADVVPTVDFAAVALNADRLIDAMTVCVPAGFRRVPGIGLQRVGFAS